MTIFENFITKYIVFISSLSLHLSLSFPIPSLPDLLSNPCLFSTIIVYISIYIIHIYLSVSIMCLPTYTHMHSISVLHMYMGLGPVTLERLFSPKKN